jgi:hypothetical protein
MLPARRACAFCVVGILILPHHPTACQIRRSLITFNFRNDFGLLRCRSGGKISRRCCGTQDFILPAAIAFVKFRSRWFRLRSVLALVTLPTTGCLSLLHQPWRFACGAEKSHPTPVSVPAGCTHHRFLPEQGTLQVAIEVVIATGFKVPVQVFARRTEKEVYRLSKLVSSSEPVV